MLSTFRLRAVALVVLASTAGATGAFNLPAHIRARRGVPHAGADAQVREALAETPDLARAIREYPVKPPAGQWNWVEDANAAMRYHEAITRTGWPKETRGFPNPYGGLTFPMTSTDE